MLHAADAVSSNSPSQTPITVLLEPQDADYGVVNWGVSFKVQSDSFKKEPAVASGKIVRGELEFVGNTSNSIPFIWQRGEGKLYLDLNRNQDLTDDPDGVFSITGGKPSNYQSFSNVRLPFTTALGKCKVLVDLNIYDYGNRPSCNLGVRTFWQGQVTLQGKDWQVGIVPNDLTRTASLENGHMLFRPWDKRRKPFNVNDGSLDSFSFARKLFIDGHGYQMAWMRGSPGGELKPTLQMTEQSVLLSDLNITGKYIERLVLGCETYTVVLDRPVSTVKIPVGNYSPRNVLLEQAGIAAYSVSTMSQAANPTVTVNDKSTAIMAVGGPLTNTVAVSRHGQDLRLDYSLVGAGGMTYQRTVQDRSKPPGFAIYKGDKSIATGTFEFG
jgi:hypothetical protein